VVAIRGTCETGFDPGSPFPERSDGMLAYNYKHKKGKRRGR
jgi:hypothetical protein